MRRREVQRECEQQSGSLRRVTGLLRRWKCGAVLRQPSQITGAADSHACGTAGPLKSLFQIKQGVIHLTALSTFLSTRTPTSRISNGVRPEHTGCSNCRTSCRAH